MKSRIETIGLMVVVLVTALSYGAVEPWSVLLFEVLAALLLAVWGHRFVASGARALTIPPIVWPLLGLIVLGAVQSIAWTNSAGTQQSLSLNVEATRRTTLVLCLLLGLSIFAANTFVRSLADRENLKSLAKTATMYGLALALFGILRHYAFKGTLPWLGQIGSETLSGVFVNRDHFAGYLEMLIGIPMALVVTKAVRGEERTLLGVAATLMGVTLIFTLSRGGMISLLAEMIFIGAMSVQMARRDEAAATGRGGGSLEHVLGAASVGAILAAILAGVLWIGAEPVIQRLGADPAVRPLEDFRIQIWRDTLQLVSRNPYLGVGLGAFPTAYPMVTQYAGAGGRVAEAHNDYLQILSDGGILGGALAAWFLVILFGSLGQGLRARDPLVASLTLGFGAGVLGMLVHSMFDFNLHLPSHALVFVLFSTLVSQLAVIADQPDRAKRAVRARPAPAPVSVFNEVSS